jgi:hypothetical protein
MQPWVEWVPCLNPGNFAAGETRQMFALSVAKQMERPGSIGARANAEFPALPGLQGVIDGSGRRCGQAKKSDSQSLLWNRLTASDPANFSDRVHLSGGQLEFEVNLFSNRHELPGHQKQPGAGEVCNAAGQIHAVAASSKGGVADSSGMSPPRVGHIPRVTRLC